ncbi:MAG TPA: hypothetical protein VGD55_12085, partial [Acidothermaceae bacterium]
GGGAGTAGATAGTNRGGGGGAGTAGATAGTNGGGGKGGGAGSGAGGASAGTVVAIPPYTISVWATGTNDYQAPDSIETDGTHIWVGYQNKTTKDGSDGGAGFVANSTVVEYTLDGTTVLKTFSLAGHVDGLRVDPTNKNVWVTSNEDGAPHLFMIDATTQVVTSYVLPSPLPHGGGLDDIGFVDGKMFVAASAPSATKATQNRPALYQVTISGTTATLTQALAGNGSATDYNVADAGVALNLTDPDSITISPTGDLVLVSQGDNQVLFVTHPGSTPAIKSLTVATQLDDTVWTTNTKGQLLVVDGKANIIYSVRRSDGWTVGIVYTETPDDSTIPNILGTLDLTTGNIQPIAVGFGKATGLLFLPQ